MAEYLIRSSLNPNKVVKCTITFRQLVNKGENGELVWLVEIGTKEPDKYGNVIPPEFIHSIVGSNTLDDAIEKATTNIASKVDWSPEIVDIRPPFVVASYPNENTQTVSVNSDVFIDMKDIMPAAGIDLSSITVVVNGIDVSSEIKIDGDPFECRVLWSPKIRDV